MKKKILFVIPVYGIEVTGGAEDHCRSIAERLTEYYDVEVATTKALSFSTWKNHFEENETQINNVKVRRFKVDAERAENNNLIEAELLSSKYDPEKAYKWLVGQGPYSSSLFNFVTQNYQEYHKIIVFQYLYILSWEVVKIVPTEKLIFVPLAHDEPIISLQIFNEEFRKPGTIVYNSYPEYELIRRQHNILENNPATIGVGIEIPEVSANPVNFDNVELNNLKNYLIYVGRVDEGKRVNTLCNHFIWYKQNHPGDLKLVLAGKKINEMPKHKDIIETGFVSYEDRSRLIAGATALVNPSKYESLSLIVLEAFAQRRPILVNGGCDVLRYHCIQSNGGLWYEDAFEFESVLEYLLHNPEKAQQMGENGYRYVSANYTWEIVMNKWLECLKA